MPYDCKIVDLTTAELQKCSSGLEIAFSGDSLCREMFTNYLQLMKGDSVDFDGRKIKPEQDDVREAFLYENADEKNKIVFFSDYRRPDTDKLMCFDKRYVGDRAKRASCENEKLRTPAGATSTYNSEPIL